MIMIIIASFIMYTYPSQVMLKSFAKYDYYPEFSPVALKYSKYSRNKFLSGTYLLHLGGKCQMPKDIFWPWWYSNREP